MPLTLLVHSFAGNNKQRNRVLLIFSFLFYAWGEPVWVLQMFVSGLLVWLVGLQLAKQDKVRDPRLRDVRRKLYLGIGVTAALIPLFIFKYAGFVVENLNALFRADWTVPQFSLPIGISFYTFQIITYLIDLYRDDAEVQRSLPDFLLYEAFFPQLIAGPIVRYRDIDRQIRHRKITRPGILNGFQRFTVGLFKKALIANFAGKLVASTLGASDLTLLSSVEVLLGIVAFSLQIYFDFSAYSDMAIGLGEIFGFHLKENFDRPYVSASVTEFWRRWHMSLGTFFRDYVYIPLGGNRRHQMLNLAVVWFLTGLWHGASWNFILWGLYFLVFLIIEKTVLLKAFERLPKFIAHLYMVPVLLFGWLLFYYTDMSQIGQVLKQLFTGPFINLTGKLLLRQYAFFLLAAAALSLTTWPRIRERFRKRHQTRLEAAASPAFTLRMIVVPLVLLFFSLAALAADSFNPFLYFRF